MKCAACEHDNTPSAKFCEECGSRLVRVCRSCKAEIAPTAKFCPECGAAASGLPSTARFPLRQTADYTPKHLADKILQSKSALEGERKQVTVLFADIQGSMQLSSELDPERWHELLDRYFAILTDAVHRFEGTVNQYTGDGIMALFGAPIAHEDHAQRACYAALEARDHLRTFGDDLRLRQGLNFGFRIGINSGDVVVGKIGDDLRMDYTAQGATVGIAQRIEQLAAPGQVYISGATEHLVAGYFKLRPMGKTDLKGLAEAVPLFELKATGDARTRLDVAAKRGLSRFVGRTTEMQILEAALAHAERGHGQVVGIVGEPGLGKSRLCFEFVERCRQHELPVFEAHCPAHGKNIPYLPILELFRNYFDIKTDDNVRQARKKIAGTLTLLDPTLQETLPVLFEFMGVSDPSNPRPLTNAEANQRQLFGLIHRVIQAQDTQGQITVTLIDDLHWVDPGSDAFVNQLVDAAAGRHSLIVLNFRPEYVAAFAANAHYQQLPLVPLGDEPLRELVADLVGHDESVSELSNRIVEWTTGNPFYAEELINALVESGDLVGNGRYRLMTAVEHLVVPTSVQAVLAARMDRLPEAAKRLLQTAAVIGKEFSGPLLEAATDLKASEHAAALECLKSGDFIYERALYPVFEYAFKHPLTHDVAYQSQLQARRAVVHAAVARALESRAGDKLEEQAALLAYHWEAAEEPAHAIDWHRRAAEWCGVTNPSGGLQHWRRVRELAAELPSDEDTLKLGARACAHIIGFRWLLGSSRMDVDRDFEIGKVLAKRAGDMGITAQLYGAYSGCLGVNLGYGNDYLEYSQEAVRFAEMADNDELKFALSVYVQAACLFCGKFEKATEIAETSQDLSGGNTLYGASLIGLSPRLTLLMQAGVALTNMGRCLDAQRLLDTAVWAPFLDEFPMNAILSQFWECHNAVLYGNHRAALAIARDMPAHVETVQTNFAQLLANLSMGEAYLANGESEKAGEFLKDCVRITDETHTGGYLKGNALARLCDTHLSLGEVNEAVRCAEAAVEYCRPRELKVTLGPWLSLARSRIRSGAQSSAIAALTEMQQIIDETGAVVYQPFLHECRASFADAFDCEWTPSDEIREAHRLFAKLGADGHVKRVAQVL